MRKWMRERLQRRKKKPAEPSDQPAPPPLQPAYFDAGAPAEQESEAPDTVESSAHPPDIASPRRGEGSAETSELQPEQGIPAAQATSRDAGKGSQETRGRRRRGGRGRGGRGREQAVAQAFTPAAVKGSIPLTPTLGGEKEGGDRVDAESEPATAASPGIAASPAAPRAPKGIVVLAIGLPGSGKSSWFKRHNIVPLSSDMMRSLLFDDVREQRYQDLVFSNLRSMLKSRLIAKRPMNYVDATNLTPQERQHWIKLAKDYQYEVQAVFFDVPLEVCIERHQRRDRVVPDDVMRRMAAKLKPPTFEEGFAKITVVRVKKKESDPSESEQG
jgi:predicted kinase